MSPPTYTSHPRITEVTALPGHQLQVCFDNGAIRHYDFRPHLDLDMFQLLRNEAFFRAVKVDAGGFGLSWNDDMDIAASELWLNGRSSLKPERLNL
jgi:hypothetical protein